MKECNGNNKNYKFITKLNDISKFFLITLVVALFLACCYVFFIVPEIIIYIFYTCFLGLGIGGTISYFLQENKSPEKHLLLYWISLYSLTTFLLFNYIYIYILNRYISSISQTFILIFFIFLLVFGIRYSVLCHIKQNKYPRKLFCLILTFLCSFFVYLIFSSVLYISYLDNIEHYSSKYFLKDMLTGVPLSPPYFCGAIYEGNAYREHMRNTFNENIFMVYEKLTFYKLTPEQVVMVVNIQIWSIEFFCTFFCAWFYIIFNCPCLSSISSSERNKE